MSDNAFPWPIRFDIIMSVAMTGSSVMVRGILVTFETTIPAEEETGLNEMIGIEIDVTRETECSSVAEMLMIGYVLTHHICE